jgi:hypothetical protein
MVANSNQHGISFQWTTLFQLIALLILSGPVLATANITARLDRNPVSLDESFHLVYEADSDVDDPDFSVLDHDFEILSSSQSTNMRSINGSWSLKKSWDLTLISKKAGVFTIPPVPFGSDASPSLRVTVKPASQAPGLPQNASGEPAQLFLEVETDSKQAWVQSQIVYTVRLLRTVNISSASLSEPETSDPDAIIERLGDDTSYDTTRNGVRYAVIERKYAIYPQHSGKLTINPLRFDGNVSTPNVRPRSFMDSFMSLNTGSRKRVLSKRVDIDVKPVPAGTDVAKWLPAKNLSLTQTWSADVSSLKTGEPVTRTLILQADGLMAEQLPEPDLGDVDGLKQYPDKAQPENTPSEDGFIGKRQIKIAMIPTHAGDYKLPAIEIPWFNTRTGKPEIARLPGVELHSIGTASAAAAPPAATPVTQAQPATSPTAETSKPLLADEQHTVIDGGIWRWISLALALGWMSTTLLLLGNRRRRTGAEQTTARARPAPLHPLKKAVVAACASKDAHQTKNALLNWARARWPDEAMTSLSDIAARSGEPLAGEIHKLNDALYSRESSWTPEVLRAAFDGAGKDAKPHRHSEATVLEPLYKT